jgi:hypothetical protein
MGIRDRFYTENRSGGKILVEEQKLIKRVADHRLSAFINRAAAKKWKLIDGSEHYVSHEGVLYHCARYVKRYVIDDPDKPKKG